MADTQDFKQVVNDAILDADSLERFINGDDTQDVLTRLSAEYPTLQKALKELFNNNGIAGRFKTLSDLQASDLQDDSYALVADDVDDKNGIYIKEGGTWVKSAYNPLSLIADSNERLGNMLDTNEDTEFLHVITDSIGKVVGSIDNKGEFDITLTDEAKGRISRVKEDLDADNALHIISPDNKVLATLPVGFFPDDSKSNEITSDENSKEAIVFIDRDNRVLKTLPNAGEEGEYEDASAWGANYLTGYPITSPEANIFIESFVEVNPKLALNTVAKGRTGSADVTVNGDGLTHPKMIYAPNGWNGYKYWLAATPTFGVIPAGATEYENPHVWASNDLEEWVEPSGGPIDLPEDGNNSYWSDTHLELADDGYLYCWYRGNSFSFSGRFVCYKRSRDGVNWSDRVMAYEANLEKFGVSRNNMIVSPSIHKDGETWVCYDIVRSSSDGLVIDSGDQNKTSFVIRRNGYGVNTDFGKYDAQQVVNYSPVSWGDDNDPWHIDSVKVGNLYLHLIAVSLNNYSKSHSCYLAWSKDGWNFNVFPEKLETGVTPDYRSSLTVTNVKKGIIELKVVIAKTSGILKLYKLKLGVK